MGSSRCTGGPRLPADSEIHHYREMIVVPFLQIEEDVFSQKTGVGESFI